MDALIEACEKKVIRAAAINSKLLGGDTEIRSDTAAVRQENIYYKDFFENKLPPVWITLNQLYRWSFSKVLEEAKKEARKELNAGGWPSLAEGDSVEQTE